MPGGSGFILVKSKTRSFSAIDGLSAVASIKAKMKTAIAEIERRRAIQLAYNKKHNITPKPIIKPIKEWLLSGKEKEITAEFGAVNDIKLLKKEMKTAAANLDFERAAELRDLIKRLKDDKKNYLSNG